MTQISDSVIDLFTRNNTHTGREILGQPELWLEIVENLKSQKQTLQEFLERIGVYSGDLSIVLTGAGSSAFIGDVAQFSFRAAGHKHARAIPTTDLVTHFPDLIDTSRPLLLVSFGRSGNSPESIAAYELAEKQCDTVHHLILTCNKEGDLAQKKNHDNTYVYTLPPSAEDQGLAMTGSFSGMLLAAALIADLAEIENHESTVSTLAEFGREILNEHSDGLKEISEMDFNRIIFLGDGPLTGCARESHLKVQELSDGMCIGKYDSFLGFRHGPKAVVDDQSLVVYLLSNQADVTRYQHDLIQQISSQKLGLHTLAIGQTDEVADSVDTSINIRELSRIPEIYLAIPYVLMAQIIGFFKSQSLGLDPDNPSRNGAISRVVEGVRIYG